MKNGEGIIISCIRALGTSITSPYPYYGLLALLEYLALSAILRRPAISGWDFACLVLVTLFLITIAVVVSRLIEKVGHDKMLSSEVLIKLAEIDAKLKLSESQKEKRRIS